MDPRAVKRALRREMVARILAMDPARRRHEEAVLTGRLENLPGFAGAGMVLLYASAFPEEIATGAMLRRALAAGKRLACPRVDPAARRLRLHEIRDPQTDLRPGVRSIPEPDASLPELAPEQIDWVLVPGLAFDRRGYRLGRGAGYYDRLLPTLRPQVPRWALILSPQWVDALPVEPHDQPLDGIADADHLVTCPDR